MPDGRGRNLSAIYELPFTDLLVAQPAGSPPLPLAEGAGSTFVAIPADAPAELAFAPEPAEGEVPSTGRIALVITEGGEPPFTLVVEHDDWSVACPLSSGQLHRLANALEGRGTRPGIRPTATGGEVVHLGGTPERLTVEHAGRQVIIPAGPRRALGKALRAAEAH